MRLAIGVALVATPVGVMATDYPNGEWSLVQLDGRAVPIPIGVESSLSDSDEVLHLCARGASRGRALLGTFEIGAILLSRDGPHARPSATIFRAADDALLADATDLAFGTRGGLDFTFEVALGPSMDLALRYFGVDRWTASRAAADPDGVRFEGFGDAVWSPAEELDYDSKLHSFEIGVRPRVVDALPVWVGFRTVQVHEGFALRVFDPLPAESIAVRTNNFLYGLQVGAEPALWGAGGPLRLEGLVKAGIYANLASASTFSARLDRTLGANRDRPAFVGEAGLSLAWKFSRFFTARGGY
ncbi:MAG: hypothetical protein NUV77_21360, partial [Thermoguttaceae bacterium]|nr:hypothetical protein [Thermoguttaceae bacterium]